MKAGVVVLGMVAALTACGGSHSPEDSHAGTTEYGAGVPVRMEEIKLTVPVEGTVVARNRAEITTRMMARVTELTADVGSRVGTGQILIRLGGDDIAANRAKAEAAVTVASMARDEAEKHAARMDALLAQDVVPLVQRDQAHLQLAQAESQLAMATASLKEVETAGSYASIRAPFAGEVVSRHIDQGDVAAPGMPLMVVEAAGPLVAAGADPMSKTVEVRVTLPADWPTGVSVTALVPLGTTQAITVPQAAVVRRGQLTGVRVVTGDGVALRWIRLGRAVDGDRVEVLSGLTEGDEIILSNAEAAQ